MRTTRILLLTGVFIFLFSLYGCSRTGGASTHTTAIEDSIGNSSHNDTLNIDEELQDRTAWNIGLSIEKQNEHGIWVRVSDYDNQGFYHNPAYFIMERYEDDSWVKVSLLSEAAEEQFIYITPPDDVDGCADTVALCRYSFMEKDLIAGRYRVTKIISGRAFSLEFDYRPD
jgi:hypothetical protein